MRDRTDFDPVFFAPFVSSAVVFEADHPPATGDGGEPSAYDIIFSRAVHEAFALLGLGVVEMERGALSCSNAEILQQDHIARPRGAVRATLRLLDYDSFRVHLLLHVHDEADGAVVAVSERVVMHLSPDGESPRRFPDDILRRLAEMRLVHARLGLVDTLQLRLAPRN